MYESGRVTRARGRAGRGLVWLAVDNRSIEALRRCGIGGGSVASNFGDAAAQVAAELKRQGVRRVVVAHHRPTSAGMAGGLVRALIAHGIAAALVAVAARDTQRTLLDLALHRLAAGERAAARTEGGAA